MHQIRQNARPTIRERREKREPRSERERGTIAPHRADERRDRRSSGAIDERARQTHTARRSMSGAIVRRETSALVDRAARSTIAIMHRAARRRGEARSSLSL